MIRSRQAVLRRSGIAVRRERSRAIAEPLENRQLLSATTASVLPGPVISPNSVTVGSVTGAKASGVAIRATVGTPFYGQVARISGLSPGSTYQLSAMINWGDGSAESAGRLFKNADGSYYVSGWHDYQSAGTFSVTVSIEATPATVSGSAVSGPIILIIGTVTDIATVTRGTAPVAGTGVTLHLTAGKAFNGSVGTFVYISPIGPPYKLVASIDWGDGIISNGTIDVDSKLGVGGYTVDGLHTYAIGGTYPITATVSLETIKPTPVVPPPSTGGSGGASANAAPQADVVATINSRADVAAGPDSGLGSITIVDGVLTILGTSGDDTITVRQTPGTPVIEPLTSTKESIVPVVGLPPHFIITINGTTTTLSTAGITSLYVNGEAGNDTIDLGGLSYLTGAYPPPGFLDEAVKLNAVIHGGGGDDTLIGGDGADSLYSDSGNDTLRATLGGDSAYGGPGDDTAINIGGYQFAYIAPDVKHIINEPPPPVAPVGPIPAGSKTQTK